MSDPQYLFNLVFQALQKTVCAQEVTTAGNSCFRELVRQDSGNKLGELKIYRGIGPVDLVITTSLLAADNQLESYMCVALGKADTAIPHLVFDVVASEGHASFHIDLLPRVDVAVEADYIDAVYEPLSAALDSFSANEAFQIGFAPRSLRAKFTPWTGLFSALAPQLLCEGEDLIVSYTDHWLHLVETGVVSSLDTAALQGRDQQHRAAIYQRSSDPLWAFLDGFIGEESTSLILGLLRGEVQP